MLASLDVMTLVRRRGTACEETEQMQRPFLRLKRNSLYVDSMKSPCLSLVKACAALYSLLLSSLWLMEIFLSIFCITYNVDM